MFNICSTFRDSDHESWWSPNDAVRRIPHIREIASACTIRTPTMAMHSPRHRKALKSSAFSLWKHPWTLLTWSEISLARNNHHHHHPGHHPLCNDHDAAYSNESVDRNKSHSALWHKLRDSCKRARTPSKHSWGHRLNPCWKTWKVCKPKLGYVQHPIQLFLEPLPSPPSTSCPWHQTRCITTHATKSNNIKHTTNNFK